MDFFFLKKNVQSSFSLSFFFLLGMIPCQLIPTEHFQFGNKQSVDHSHLYSRQQAWAKHSPWILPWKVLPVIWSSSTLQQGWKFSEFLAFSCGLGSWSTSWKLIMPWNLPVKGSITLLLWQTCKLRHWKAHGGKEGTRRADIESPAWSTRS